MNQKRNIFAFVCAFAVMLLCIPNAHAMGFYDADLGFGPGDASVAENTQTPAPESQTPAAGEDSQAQTSGESSEMTPEQMEQQQQQQQQLDDLNQQISDLQQQQSALQQQIDATKDQKEQAQLQKDNIDSQLYSTSQQIQLTQQKIDLLQQNIDQANEQIAGLEQSLANQYDQFKESIRSSYMAPDYSFWEYLLGSESFADFSVRVETVTRMSERDQSVIDQLEAQIEELNATQESLANDKAELEGSTASLETLKNQLSSQSAEAQEYISDINAMEQAFLADTAALQEKQKQIQAEIDQIYANLESTGEYQGDGTWAWPVPGYSYISSPYGWRFQGTDFHTGMDIAGSGTSIYGARIVACGAGTVVKVQNNGSSGYGLFCIIDHGGGYTTLYAHTSSIVVSVGDVVEKGQTIGYVGNSGWVIPSPSPSNPTGGSHLHVEFRIDGAHQDPAGFLY